MANDNKNFKGQDLRGRSFKGQDLTGADFSDCDLHGVDFSFANLTRAKFVGATLGCGLIMTVGILILRFLLSVVAGLIVSVGITLALFVANDLFKINQGFILTAYVFCFILVSYFSLMLQNSNFLLVFLFLFIIGIKVLAVDGYLVSVFAISFVLFVVIAEVGAGLLAIAGTGLVAGARVADLNLSVGFVVTLGIVIGNGFLTVIIFGIGVEALALSAFKNNAVDAFILFGLYLGYRANSKEESQLSFLRHIGLQINVLGGTQFSFATLHRVDFAEADLKHAIFKNTKILNCNFQNAKNHHLALIDGTPLESRKVRDLVIDGIITDKNFATLDLRGLDFSHLNLQGFDFSHANLSGANLSHTQMTGAILEGWNIDTETNLEGIDCRYYYFEKVKNEDSEEEKNKKRMPSEGEEYKAGEFTRIFQKIANTIDFIAHNEMELAAIKLSVEQVRVESGNDDIRVQAIETKDGFIVVKVAAPKTEDRGVLHNKIKKLKHKYEAEIQLLMKNNHIQIGNIETLQEQMEKQRQDFFNAIQKLKAGDTVIGDKNIITTITDSTVHGSVVTAETVENSFNVIQNLSSEHDELKTVIDK